MRKQPGSPSSTNPNVNQNVITQIREYELITPLFGGGVHSNEADPVTIIRGSEVRGNLRFWWRASRGGQFSDLSSMKDAEDKLWGKAYEKGDQGLSTDNTVQIIVGVLTKGTEITVFDKNGRFDRNSKVPDYAAFPLQPDDSQKRQQSYEPPKIHSGISFKLTISFPKSKEQDVEAALWAWETFGGIGGRTRRGFGAMRLRKVNGKEQIEPFAPHEVFSSINEQLTKYIPSENFPSGVPHLSKNLQLRVVLPELNDPIVVWNNLVQALKRFRQIRTKGNSGRSFWPEASTIRQIAKQQGKVNPDQSVKFPRASFGLPIIFHFKDEPQLDGATLKGQDNNNKEIERLASPLILRPLVCKNNQTVGIALLLEGSRPIPGKLILSGIHDKNIPVKETLTGSEAKSIPVLNGEIDVLRAFMKSLDTSGGKR